MRFDGFDWDAGNQAKCRKHGVSVEEIEALFGNGSASVFPDVAHSRIEARWFAIGPLILGRWVFLVFTLRDRGTETLLRPISARHMPAREIAYYEKEIARSTQR